MRVGGRIEFGALWESGQHQVKVGQGYTWVEGKRDGLRAVGTGVYMCLCLSACVFRTMALKGERHQGKKEGFISGED